MTNTTKRLGHEAKAQMLLRIVLRLFAGETITYPWLSDTLGLERRTAERYLATLKAMGLPLVRDFGSEGGVEYRLDTTRRGAVRALCLGVSRPQEVRTANAHAAGHRRGRPATAETELLEREESGEDLQLSGVDA